VCIANHPNPRYGVTPIGLSRFFVYTGMVSDNQSSATRSPTGVMSPSLKKRSKKSGLPPGTPIHIGLQKTEDPVLNVVTFRDADFHEKTVSTAADCLQAIGDGHITWISLRGLHDLTILQQLAEGLGIHPLVVEDIANTEQRPKIEDYDSYHFLVLKWIQQNSTTSSLAIEQISIIQGSKFLLSFEEGPDDIFYSVRHRIRGGKGHIRTWGTDYLAYTLIDAVVDHYFSVLESLGETIEQLEEELIVRPDPQNLHKLHQLKRDMILLRKAVWPCREVIAHLERGESPLLTPATTIYFRDIYDHTIQVIETTETYRDMLAGMLDIYLTSLSNRLNETMKVLTMMATLFIPLTFIAGIYGMNFTYMPELEWPWGYPAILALMGLLTTGMLWYFRKKRWL